MKIFSWVTAAVLCLVLVVSCASQPRARKATAQTKDQPPVQTSDVPAAEPAVQQVPPYRIGIGDVLEVSVWRAKGMDVPKEVIVRPDGVISYPLVGDLKTVGLTLVELDAELTRALKAYIRNPEVSVAIRRFGGTKVIVLGEVKAPGVYSPTGQGSVLEVIALANGFTDDAVRSGTFLIRGGLANPQPVKLNLARALVKGDMSQNPPLMPNDIIYVPRNAAASFNYVMRQLTPTLSNLLLGTTAVRDIYDIKTGRGY